MIYRDGDTVTVTDPSDRWYGERGYVTDWHWGMSRTVVYWIQLDVREDPVAFTADQLTLGERVEA